MKRYLPPFAAVRAFEVAAKHESFKIAANEIHLSASAISHQVRALEDFLDTSLFIRENGNVRLTEQGREYAKSISSILDNLEDATMKLNPKPQNNKLVINLDYSFLACWLEREIGEFYLQHPAVDIEFVASTIPPNVDVDYDVAIYFSIDPHHKEHTYPLIKDSIFLVTSPELADKLNKEPNEKNILNHSLLHCSLHPNEWKRWFDAYNLTLPEKYNKLTFNNRFSVFNSATRNLGLAIARQPGVHHYLISNKLVAPYNKKVETGYYYYFTYARHAAYLPIAREFHNWLSHKLNLII